MAPNITSQTLLLAAETESVHTKSKVVNKSTNYTSPTSESDNLGLGQEKENYEWKISWRNVLAFIYLHTAGVYGLLLMLTGHTKLYTILFGYLVALAAGLGVTAGAHRLWAHKAYKAKWQFRLILAFFQAMAFQNHIYEWVRDHRVHHKFTDTNADPHNAQRGFFFSHIGWLMVRKHPDVKNKGKTVDMSDLEKDPIVMWQKKFYLIVMPFLTFVFPTIVPIYCWNEDPWIAWYTCIFRYALSLNGTWLVNSAAHIWGTKPYDKNISPTENTAVGIIAFGEGWHNYHHVFPWDYKAAELGNYRVNMTTALIDFFAKIGWAYDLKTVPLEMIKKRAERTGDGSLKDPHDPRHHMNSVWGWDDKDMSHEDKIDTSVFHPKLE